MKRAMLLLILAAAAFAGCKQSSSTMSPNATPSATTNVAPSLGATNKPAP